MGVVVVGDGRTRCEPYSYKHRYNFHKTLKKGRKTSSRQAEKMGEIRMKMYQIFRMTDNCGGEDLSL